MEIFDTPNNIDLNMSIIQNTKEDDYIFYSKIDETTLHFTDKINILEEMQNRDSYEHNVCLDYNFFLNDIKKSYKDNDSIRHQFSVDLERCDVYLNKHIVKDRKKIINYLDKNFKGNKNFKKIVETSAFCSEDNNIINDNYIISKDQKIGIIPPIGGG